MKSQMQLFLALAMIAAVLSGCRTTRNNPANTPDTTATTMVTLPEVTVPTTAAVTVPETTLSSTPSTAADPTGSAQSNKTQTDPTTGPADNTTANQGRANNRVKKDIKG